MMNRGPSFHSNAPSKPFKVAPGTRVLGRYRLESVCGMGGTASVWRARLEGTQHLVAIKIQNNISGNGAQRAERLEREFQFLTLVRSPQIVSVSDYGVLPDGRAALVFEYMRGQTLREWLEEEDTFGMRSALEVTRQLLQALKVVHEHGIVHRDIKPDNIMITHAQAGHFEMKLFDFGIAKFFEDAPGVFNEMGDGEIAELLMPLTSAEMTVGTPEYMAPEQISATHLGPYTDVYAVGIVMYEMLFGEVPYTGRNFFEVAHKHLNGILPPLPAELPDQVHRLIWRALASRTEDRYPNTEAMLADIDHALAALDHNGHTQPETTREVDAFLADEQMATWTLMDDQTPMAPMNEPPRQARDVAASSVEARARRAPVQWLDDDVSPTHEFSAAQGDVRRRTYPEPDLPQSDDPWIFKGGAAKSERFKTPREEVQLHIGAGGTAQLSALGALIGSPPPAPRRPPTVVETPWVVLSQDEPAQCSQDTPAAAPWEIHEPESGDETPPTREMTLKDRLAILSDQSPSQSTQRWHGAMMEKSSHS